MKTPRSLLAAVLLLPLAGCETTTPAQRYAQSQQLVAQAYGNKLSPVQQAALATAIYQQAEATRAIQQAQAAAAIQNGFNNAGQIIANGARPPQSAFTTYTPNSSYTTFGDGSSAFTTHTGNSSYTTFSP